LDPKVAHYTGHEELGNAVKAGWDAHEAGDVDQAAAEWGRAVALAAKLGHDKMLTRLGRLVDIVGDPSQGLVHVKPNLLPRQIFSGVMASFTSTHSPDSVGQQTITERPTGADRKCPECSHVSPAAPAFCTLSRDSLPAP